MSAGKIAKVLLIIFTGIFWALGIVILGIGIWIKADLMFANLGQAIKVGMEENVVEHITWIFIGSGIFVFAVGFAGFLGAIRESKVMLGFYIVCIFIVFAAEVSAGAYAGIRKDALITDLKVKGKDWLYENYNPHPNAEHSIVSRSFNYVQQWWGCCGVKNFLDYKNGTYINQLGPRIKKGVSMSFACCKSVDTLKDPAEDRKETISSHGLEITAEDKEVCMDESIAAVVHVTNGTTPDLEFCEKFNSFKCKGCVDVMNDWIDEHMIIILAVGVSLGILQLILLILGLWFCQSIGDYEEQKDEDGHSAM